jgi:hypothetical protein
MEALFPTVLDPSRLDASGSLRSSQRRPPLLEQRGALNKRKPLSLLNDEPVY